MDEYKLKRKIDGKHEVVYTFPSKFVLKAGRTVKVKIFFTTIPLTVRIIIKSIVYYIVRTILYHVYGPYTINDICSIKIRFTIIQPL